VSLIRKIIYIKIFIVIFVSIVFISGISADNTVGLIMNDNSQSFDGYTLFAPNLAKATYLIDNNGNLVHQWESGVVPGMSAYLLEDGNLLRAAQLGDPTGQSNRKGGFELVDWDNNPIWSFYHGTQHHDIEYLPNGNVLMVVTDRKNEDPAMQAGRNDALIAEGYIWSISILEIKKTGDDTGEIVWQWNAWDHLIQDFDDSKDNFGVVADHPELIDINFPKDAGANWVHTNSVAYNEEFDQIILSNRGTSEIWIIDHSVDKDSTSSHKGGNSGKGGDLLYRWGNPIAYGAGTENDQMLFGQHDAHWIASGLQGEGNILIFNNGWSGRGYSSIEELTPPVDGNGDYTLTTGTAYGPSAQLWTYTTPAQTDFSSGRFGGSQRLPNGNTLICNANSGEFFEVDTTEEIVWKYQNPVDGDNILNRDDQPVGNLQVFRCYRYSSEYPGLDGKDLTPGEPIELYTPLAVNDESGKITNFKLYDNYPNPFNPTTAISYSLDKDGDVLINIYDISGKLITALQNEYQTQGEHSITWDGVDDSGNKVGGGVYFCQVITGDFIQTKKMVLLK
jgi:hypothetical protein